MLWGGVAYYDSAVLPVAPEVKERGDPLAACVAACRKHGVQCHVWKVNWNMGFRAPADFAARMRREGRTQVGYDGKPEPQWLCPSHPANRQLEIAAMVEVAAKYDAEASGLGPPTPGRGRLRDTTDSPRDGIPAEVPCAPNSADGAARLYIAGGGG